MLVQKKIKAVYTKVVRLPSDYQEVEYIQSTGSQYILTDIYPTPNYSLTSRFSIQNTSSDKALFVCQNPNNGVRWGVSTYSGKWQVTGPCYPESNPNYGSISTNTIYDIDYCYTTATTFSASGTAVRTGMSIGSSNPGYKLAIFSFNNGNDIIYKSNMTLYSLKIYNSKTLVADYVPCYRKSDNVIGLYDLVSNQFYTNAGTGTFSKGADINDMVRIRPDGYMPGANTLLYLPLSEDLKDYGGKNISITNSGVSIATKGNVKCGYFNGSSYLYTNTTDGTNFDFGTNQDFTVSWYMYKNTWSGTTTLINKKYNDSSHGWIIYKDSNDDLRFRISSSNLDTKINSSTSTGVRALYTFIRKGTTTYIYKNGVLTNTGNGNGNASYSSKGLYIGGGPYTSWNPSYLNGYLSNVIIEKKARTAEEISSYYNLTKSNYGL